MDGEWQPIATAPNDCRVLVYFQGAGAIVAYRDPEEPDHWVGYLGYGKSNYWPSVHEDHATHWQPLPSPPDAESHNR